MRECAKARILEAAEGVFAEKGYDGATLAAITRSAGVSHGLANYYFSSKHDLLAEVLRARLTTALELTSRLPAQDPDRSLARLIDATIAAAADAPVQSANTLAAMLQPGTRNTYAAVEADEIEPLRSAEDRIRAIFAARGAERPDIEEVLLRSLLEGVVFKIAVYPDTYPVEAVRRRIHEMYSLDVPDDASGQERAAAGPEIRLRAPRRA